MRWLAVKPPQPNRTKKMRELPKEYGDRSEDLATAFLESNGFRIVQRNYFAKKLGEIDIIAIKDEVLHFIEVKASKADFNPVYNITPTKLRRVINSAQYYLKEKRVDMPFCIDALLIRKGKVELLENITM